MIDIGRAIQHPFQDQNWITKLGIGALVNAVPILNFAGYGYMLEHFAQHRKRFGCADAGMGHQLRR